MPEIETSRLHLRLFTPDDLDDLARLFGDSDVMRYLGVEGGKTLTRAEAQTALGNFAAGWQKHGYGRWAAVLKATRQFVGMCGLRRLEDTPELLYVLSKDYWGQGLAGEAAQACLRFAFEELQLERVVAVTRPDNVRSQQVLTKVGMRYVREVRHYGVHAREYAITRAEFRADDSFYVFYPD
ncbi:MAG TPA: GNAT family N-acetyltransferase [Pyrinomonadaceae bacterium]|jgi:ribosomal-protein-alanine N-acetyltransferase